MFSIRIPYQDETASVKLSSATIAASIEARTKGLAFKYVRQGSEWYRVGEEIIEVPAGSFMILPQEQAFEAIAQPRTEAVTGICVDFANESVLNNGSYNGDELLFGLPFALSELKGFCSTDAFAQAFSQSPNPHLAVKQLQQEIAQFYQGVQLISLVLHQHARKKLTKQRLLIRLLRARQYVSQNYCCRIRLQDIAQASELSPHRLQRLFKATFGQSPQQLQQELRLRMALYLLRNHTLSLSVIAHELGYTDLAAFSNQFQQYYQERPSAMRRSLL